MYFSIGLTDLYVQEAIVVQMVELPPSILGQNVHKMYLLCKTKHPKIESIEFGEMYTAKRSMDYRFSSAAVNSSWGVFAARIFRIASLEESSCYTRLLR